MRLVEEERAAEHLRQGAARPLRELDGHLLAIQRRLRLHFDLDQLVREQGRARGGHQAFGDPLLADEDDGHEVVPEGTQVAGGAAADRGGHGVSLSSRGNVRVATRSMIPRVLQAQGARLAAALVARAHADVRAVGLSRAAHGACTLAEDRFVVLENLAPGLLADLDLPPLRTSIQCPPKNRT